MLAAEQIVLAVAALLAGVPAFAGKVYTDHPWPFSAEELPAWRVGEGDEEVIQHGANFPARNQHELTVRCEGYVAAADNLRQALNNDMAAPALAALFASKQSSSLSIGNTAMVLQRIERDTVQEGQAACGRITLYLRVRFHTSSNAPEVIN